MNTELKISTATAKLTLLRNLRQVAQKREEVDSEDEDVEDMGFGGGKDVDITTLLSEEGRKSVSYLVASMKAGAEEAAFALEAAGRTLPAQVMPDTIYYTVLYCTSRYIYIYI